MDKNKAYQIITLNTRCNYSHTVKSCENLILSCHLYREYKPYKELSYPYIIKGNLKGKGTRFMIRRADLNMLLFYELTEIIMTDYYSRFKYNIYKTIPETFQYHHLVEIRYVNENECFVRSSLIYDNKIFFSEKDFQHIIILATNTYKSIEVSLRKCLILKLSTAYTIINCNIELIWNIVRNMKMIHKYIHLLCDKIDYNGEILKKNNIIQLVNIKGNNIFISHAKVIKCKLIKNELTKECIIELLFQKDKQKRNIDSFLIDKIVLRIYEFNGECSLYILFFFQNINEFWKNEKFTKKKNKELKKFKNMIENYKQNINNINLNDNENEFNFESNE